MVECLQPLPAAGHIAVVYGGAGEMQKEHVEGIPARRSTFHGHSHSTQRCQPHVTCHQLYCVIEKEFHCVVTHYLPERGDV